MNRLYFEYLKVILLNIWRSSFQLAINVSFSVESLTVYEEMVMKCIYIVFFCLFIFITSNVNEYNVYYYYTKSNPSYGLNMVADAMTINLHNPHKSHIWKTYKQKLHSDFSMAFIIHIIGIICSFGFRPDYVGSAVYLRHE